MDLDKLIKLGKNLLTIMPIEYNAKKKIHIKKNPELKNLCEKYGSFSDNYQNWYSESLVIINCLLPERKNDFIKLYSKPKGRKDLNIENYVIEDYLRGLSVDSVVDPNAAISCFKQQLHILESLRNRFQSSLFDLKADLQSHLFDSELDAANEINEKGFTRGAGAMAGVVLEHHLSEVCNRHGIKVGKKYPCISDYNDILKENKVIEIKDWRFIQYLGDLRNLCDHKGNKEPTKTEIQGLIDGVGKISKTIL